MNSVITTLVFAVSLSTNNIKCCTNDVQLSSMMDAVREEYQKKSNELIEWKMMMMKSIHDKRMELIRRKTDKFRAIHKTK